MVSDSVKSTKNIFSFSIRYIINYNLSPASDCRKPSVKLTFHVVAGCMSYLDRFTWRHVSALNFLAKTLLSVNDAKVYVGLPGYKGEVHQ